jgi:hypothetical protein
MQSAITQRILGFFATLRLRPHLSTGVSLIPVLAVLFLVNFPGWRVARVDFMLYGAFEAGVRPDYEHGWPLTYLSRRIAEIKEVGGKYVEVDYSPWDLPDGIIDSNWRALAGDLIIGAGVLLLTGVIIEARRRRRRSCIQFHLWELFVFVALVAIGLSFYAVRRREYFEECRIFRRLHPNDATLDWTPNGHGWLLEGPDWLMPVLGKDRYNELFKRLVAIDLREENSEDVVNLRHLVLVRLLDPSSDHLALLPQIPKLQAVQVLYLSDPDATIVLPPLPRLRALNVWHPTGSMDDPWSRCKITGLAGLESLESFNVQDREFGGADVAELGGLTHLRFVDLTLSKITAASVRHLEKATGLDWLTLAQTPIGDDALAVIGRMKVLTYLDVSETRVTDAGLESLKSLTDLQVLHIEGTSVTEAGVRGLRQALPKCRIEWSSASPYSVPD